MECMNRFALAVLVYVIATTAHAGDSKLSLLNCGLQFGDAPKVSKAYSASKNNRRFGGDQVVRSIEMIRPDISSFKQTTTDHTLRRRLPSVFTFAKFVCSW